MVDRSASSSRDSTLRLVFLVCCLLLLAVSAWVYQPGKSGPLLLDDWANLSVLERTPDGWDGFRSFVFGNTSGPTGRPLSMLSFYLDSSLEGSDWPIEVASFKQTNIVIHVLTILGVLGFSLCVFHSLGVGRPATYLLSLCSAAFWGLHPLNVSTVLYLVQRMTQLVTLFSLLSLTCFIIGRTTIVRDASKGLVWLILALLPFGVLAVLSKENGVLLLVSFVIIELTLFQRFESNKLYARWFGLGVVFPLCLVVAYLGLSFSSSVEYYDYRAFGLMERMLTESRVLMLYLSNIFLPQVATFGLYHDDFVVSSSLWQPLTTALSTASIVLLMVLAVKMRARHPMFSFAVLWFFSWHFLESTYLPLELYFEHRNYLPMVGPILAASYYLALLVQQIEWRYFPYVAAVMALLGVLLLSSLTLQLTRLWGTTGALISHWAEQHPRSVRAQSDLATIYAQLGQAEQGLARLQSLKQLYPDDINLRLQIFNYICTNRLQAEEPIEAAARIAAPEIFRSDTNVHVSELVNSLRLGTCQYPDQKEMLSLMDALDKLAMSKREEAIFNIHYSELLAHYGQVDAALARLNTAFEAEPSVDIAITQSSLAGSVGRFEDALRILGKAYEADDQRRLLLPSRRAEIDDWRERIEALL